MKFSHEILSESKSDRFSILENCTDKEALEILNKPKPFTMPVWKGKNYTITTQVAKYYEVTEKAVKHLLERNNNELKSEVKKLTGKDLQDARYSLNLPLRTSQALIWTSLGILRSSIMLQTSWVAERVREELGIPKIKTLTLKEVSIEAFATSSYGGKRQVQTKSKRRIDIFDGICVAEIKKGGVTARHVGQLFEYMNESGLKKGRLIGLYFSPCAFALIEILKSKSYEIETITYQ